MRRGRDKFFKVKKILNIISFFIKLLPKKLRIKYYYHLRYKKGYIGIGLRYATLKTIAKKLGNNVLIHEGVYLLNPQNISIGDNVSIHPMSYIEAFGFVKIGNDVSIAHSATILSVNHQYTDLDIPIKDQGINCKSVIIEDNVWIGAKSTILYGCTVKNGSVIAAGAVVTKNYGNNNVLAGVPARVIKER